LYLLGVAAIILVPAVIGIFWGAGLDCWNGHGR